MFSTKINPDTVIVLLGLIAVLVTYAFTREVALLTLASALGGGLAGVAKGSAKQDIQVDNVEKVTAIDNTK